MVAIVACDQNPNRATDSSSSLGGPESQSAAVPSAGLAAAGATTAAVPVGWSSFTRYHWAETQVQRNVVTAANAAVGISPASQLAYSGGTWMTDIAGGDGARMRRAISIYPAWLSAPGGVTLATTRTRMLQQFSDSAYATAQRGQLVDYIIARENRWGNFIGPVAPIATDQQTLDELAIRTQCMEFVQRIAIGAGGHGKAYSTPGVSNTAAYRPGMALYQGTTHAMIMVDLYFTAAGIPTQARVAESNWPTPSSPGPWSNPAGQVPWLRTVQNTRIEPLNSGVKVVDLQ